VSVREKGLHVKPGDLISLRVHMLHAPGIELPDIVGTVIRIIEREDDDIGVLVLLDSSGKKIYMDAMYDFKVGLDWHIKVIASASG